MIGFFSGWSAKQYLPQMDFRPDFVSRGGGVDDWLAAGKRPLIGAAARGFGHAYVHGEADGATHFDAIQQAKRPDIAWEGSGLVWARVPCGTQVEVTHPAPTIFGAYYMVPTEGLVRFQTEKMLEEVKPGVWGIEFDEPEFFH